ncbi:MAG TPA: hypothetical protein VJN72_13955 [Gaiellales bacterium]|nr:hypothetical protein [Gaiellales bacterium]
MKQTDDRLVSAKPAAFFDEQVDAAKKALPACRWCGEVPEVKRIPQRGVDITVAHRADCPTLRHPELHKLYRRQVKKALRSLREGPDGQPAAPVGGSDHDRDDAGPGDGA